MRLVLILAFIILMGGFAPVAAQEPVATKPAISELTVDQLHGMAAIREYMERSDPTHHRGGLPEFSASPYFSERMRDPNGRRYIFVGFPLDAQRGYVALFESCPGNITAYSLSFVGLTDNLPGERAGFLQGANDPSSDYPDPCNAAE